MAQYELAGGRRGRSEQWLREGMAEWVAAWILERLGEERAHERRQRVLAAVAAVGSADHDPPLDLVALGHPRGWQARLLAAGRAQTYDLAFLLTDDLVRRRGIDGVTAYFRAFTESDDRFGHFHRAFGESIRDFEGTALDRIRRAARTVRRVMKCVSLSAPGAEVLPVDLLEECARDAD